MNRLLKIIDNDVSKEKIIFKINYSLFLENKEMIFKILNDGYNMALVKDDQFQNNNYVNLFNYV